MREASFAQLEKTAEMESGFPGSGEPTRGHRVVCRWQFVTQRSLRAQHSNTVRFSFRTARCLLVQRRSGEVLAAAGSLNIMTGWMGFGDGASS